MCLLGSLEQRNCNGNVVQKTDLQLFSCPLYYLDIR